MKTISFAVLFLTLNVTASEVLWGLFSAEMPSSGEPGVQVYYYGPSSVDSRAIQPEIGLRYDYTGGDLTSINGWGYSNVGINLTIWVDAVYGDVLVDGYFEAFYASGDRVYFENGYFDPYWGETATMYARKVSPGETLYIAFAGEREYYPFYGWMAMEVDGAGVTLITSALTFDSGLIVGTDMFATPEPSSGLLLLLGLAGLTLRRRPQRR